MCEEDGRNGHVVIERSSSPSTFIRKTVHVAMKNSTCSGGWVRLLVQCTFAAITVTSFILIVYMSMNLTDRKKPVDSNFSPCKKYNCRVECKHIPLYGYNQNEILVNVMNVDTNCNQIFLILVEPIFEDGILPLHWLSEIRRDVYEIQIIGGNLKHIAHDAFLSGFGRNIKSIVLNSVTLRMWSPMILHGLMSLERLTLDKCDIIDSEENALALVSSTLNRLTITRSGIWEPPNITGGTKLTNLHDVEFSSNNLSAVISKNSFTSLEYCKILNLNHNQITAISEGAFDNLIRIEVLLLNNNRLVTVPEGLLNQFINVYPRPEIDLLGNPWHCSCSMIDLLKITYDGMLIGDPTCFSPDSLKGVKFSELLGYCNVNLKVEVILHDQTQVKFVETDSDYNTSRHLVSCHYGDIRHLDTNISLVSPVSDYQCISNNISSIHIFWMTKISKSQLNETEMWIKPTFFMQKNIITVLEVGSDAPNNNYGIVWYQDSCPNKVYCINVLPNSLKVYNINSSARYTFCPLYLDTGGVDLNKCIVYNSSDSDSIDISYGDLWLFICIAFIFLLFGAFMIYFIIRMYPSLLKGSKRVLFVKHKSVDAIILPPTASVNIFNEKKSNLNQESLHSNKCAFTLPERQLSKNEFVLRNSMKSTKSMAPSYVSAYQPTNEQLVEWRLQHHFDNNLTITSISSGVSVMTKIYEKEFPYHSLDNNDIYESLK